LDEKTAKDQRKQHEDILHGIEDLNHPMYKPLHEFLAAHPNNKELLDNIMREDGIESYFELIQMQ